MPLVTVEVLDAGCCGLAGSFGFDADHETVSRKIGEDLWLPKLRAALAAGAGAAGAPAEKAAAAGESYLVVDGFSCHTQLEHLGPDLLARYERWPRSSVSGQHRTQADWPGADWPTLGGPPSAGLRRRTYAWWYGHGGSRGAGPALRPRRRNRPAPVRTPASSEHRRGPYSADAGPTRPTSARKTRRAGS